MNVVRKIFNKNGPYLFFIKYVFCFLALYLFYPFYRGITAPGGSLYSPFLYKYLNLVKLLTSFFTGSARFILKKLQFVIYQPNYHTLHIQGSRGISVNPSCLGWGVMSFWVAFVFANDGNKVHKLKWMVSGIAAISLLNIVRIVLIAVANHLNWVVITSLDSHQTFNIFSYGMIFALMYVYTRLQRKYEGNERNRKQQAHKLSAV